MPRTPPDMQTGGAPSTSPRSDNTVPRPQPQGPTTQDVAAPRLPHERDESSDSQGDAPQPEPSQAKRDVDRGIADTSKAEATDPTYQRQKSKE